MSYVSWNSIIVLTPFEQFCSVILFNKTILNFNFENSSIFDHSSISQTITYFQIWKELMISQKWNERFFSKTRTLFTRRRAWFPSTVPTTVPTAPSMAWSNYFNNLDWCNWMTPSRTYSNIIIRFSSTAQSLNSWIPKVSRVTYCKLKAIHSIPNQLLTLMRMQTQQINKQKPIKEQFGYNDTLIQVNGLKQSNFQK